MKNHEAATKLLDLIESRVLAGNLEPIVGYTTFAAMIGWEGGAKNGQTAGQVTSLLDHACFKAGLPMLALNFVRNAKGKINGDSFIQGIWEQFREEIVDVATQYAWTADDFMSLRRALASLPEQGVRKLNEQTVDQGQAFIRQNLHLNVPTAFRARHFQKKSV